MKKTSVFCMFVCVMALSPAAAGAEAPPYLPIQGILMDAAGEMIDGEVDVILTIYDAEAVGNALWTESQTLFIEDGFFTAYLGDITTLDLAIFRDYTDLWLGIQVEDDAEMDRVYLGSSGFAGYAEYCGNVPEHGHGFDDLTGTLPDEALPGGAVVGEQTCEGTDKVTGVDMSGVIVCGTDEGNEYLAGTGLTLTGQTFSADLTALQARVMAVCGEGSSIRIINEDGSVVCEDDDGMEYTAGTGISIIGSTISADFSGLQADVTESCSSDQAIRVIEDDGGVICQDVYTGDITGITTAAPLAGGCLSGTCDLSIDTGALQTRVTGSCSGNQAIREIYATGLVDCRDVYTGDITSVNTGSGLTGGGPSGDVTLSVATNGITSGMIQDGAVTNADVSGSAAIAPSKISGTALTQSTVFGGDVSGTYNNLQLGSQVVGASELANNIDASGKNFNADSVDGFDQGATVGNFGVRMDSSQFMFQVDGICRVETYGNDGWIRIVHEGGTYCDYAVRRNGAMVANGQFSSGSVNINLAAADFDKFDIMVGKIYSGYANERATATFWKRWSTLSGTFITGMP